MLVLFGLSFFEKQTCYNAVFRFIVNKIILPKLLIVLRIRDLTKVDFQFALLNSRKPKWIEYILFSRANTVLYHV